MAGSGQTSISTVQDILHTSGNIPKLLRALPHVPSRSHADVCTPPLSHRKTFDWIDSIVIIDYKYCTYDNTAYRKHLLDFDGLPEPIPEIENHDKGKLLAF
ncbi:hypothetical protein Y032_0029g1930 [Ancylostoma ceylanicum]|uniref:Uncharacterized protein n=1 Tax=Ancylostoma ceylanicum TaxID=53326 RepID=A0A016UTR9_9BILA|nr:hypothetical protein Y032_0029g1930 [Ancylostoma ceylanicum]